MENPSVSIVIPVFNEETYLGDCLESILALDYPEDRLEVILVDNGSTDRSMEIAANYGFKLLEMPDVKVGAVRNFGALKASGDYIAFIDADCVVDSGWLKRCLETTQKGYNAVGGLYLLREQPSWIERYWILQSSVDSVYQDSFVGGCIFLEAAAFADVDGFDEAMSAGEDTDLTNRLIKRGYKTLIEPAISNIHLGYPRTISSFVKRQVWHSEDYLQNLPGTLKDKTFILTLLYSFGLVGLVVSAFSACGYLTVLAGLCFLGSPLVLTFKRLIRSSVRSIKLYEFPIIYFIDHLYLVGRTMGLLRSLSKLLFNKGNDIKYARR